MLKPRVIPAAEYSPPETWTGSAFDATGYGSMTIHCTVAPSVAPTIQTSPDGATWSTQSAIMGDFSIVTTVAAIGRYDLAGGCHIRLNGGTGGTFKLAGRR